MVTIVIHRIVSVTFYQTITFHEKTINGRKAFNTLDTVLLPGVEITREGESIVINHKDFKDSYCVGMANVRHYRFEKAESNEDEKQKALERNKSIGTAAESHSDNDSSDLINSSQYGNTSSQITLDQAIADQNEKIANKAFNDSIKKKMKKKAKKKTKKKVSKKCTPKKKKSS